MDSLEIKKPSKGSYPAYYDTYFSYIDEQPSILENWVANIQDSIEFWNAIEERESFFRYEEGKWSIKEVLLHIIDTERVFTFRALSIARGETKVLPGFDHNAYVLGSNADARSWASLLQEYQSVKQASLDLFSSFSMEQWKAEGAMEAGPVNMQAFAYVIPGHDRHHQRIVRDRYLLKLRNA